MIRKADYQSNDVPGKPGVYVFRDGFREVIYVGKAKSLRKRLAAYLQPSRSRTADPKLRSLINSIEYLEVFPVRSEHESLLLESKLIKQYSPRYNIMLRDDKRFLLTKLDLEAPYPKLQLARLKKDDGCKYYGPFPVAGALRATLNYLTRYFGLRTCTPRIPGEQDFRHCHDDVIRHCTAPCLGKISREDYRKRVMRLLEVVEGKTTDIRADLAGKMQDFAQARNYESAARLRDVQHNLEEVFGAKKRGRNFSRARIGKYPGPAGLEDLQRALALPKAPRHIECFDISNIMGQFTVASMVCFRNGKPANKDYRHYRIKTVEGMDDFASMREVVMRRYKRLRDEDRLLPDLIVIDGGSGQLHAAHQVLVFLGIDRDLPVISLAKREEEVYTIHQNEPLRLEPDFAGALRLLQALRDEAHRFAITYNRELRRKRIIDSLLDEIPGIGLNRKQLLLKSFGSVKTLRKYGPAEIRRRVPGIGPKLAAEIVRHLQTTGNPPK